MRRVLLAVVLLLSLLAVIAGGVAFVLDEPTVETSTAPPDAEPVRPTERTRIPGRTTTTPTAVPRGESAPGADAMPIPRSEADWKPPIPLDLLRDPIRETPTSSPSRVVGGGIGGRAGGSIGVSRPRPPRVEASGVVVDAESGAPIASADLAVVIPRRSDRPWGYFIRMPDGRADGTFSVRTRGLAEAEMRAAELVVRAAGYRSWRGRIESDELRVALEPLEPGSLSATISGRATDEAGRRLYGPVLFALYDEFGGSEAQWALADKDGRFRLEGLRPGRWWVRVHDGANQPWTEVRLATGTVASVDVRGKLLREPPANGGFGPRREVVVRAAGAAEHSVVRAQRDHVLWRTTLIAGEARLELPRGGWTIVVGEERTQFVSVQAGSGAQVFTIETR